MAEMGSEDAAVRAAEIRAMASEHLQRYVGSDGSDGFLIHGFPALILTTVGRRSGEPRSTPLIFGEQDGRYALVASFAGLPRHPAWYLNLVAEPSVHVQVRGERFAGRARTASGAEREELRRLMVGVYPLYAEYATKTERELPVVVVERV